MDRSCDWYLAVHQIVHIAEQPYTWDDPKTTAGRIIYQGIGELITALEWIQANCPHVILDVRTRH